MTGMVTVSANITITTEPGVMVTLKRDSTFTGDMIQVTGALTLQAGQGGALTLNGNGTVVTDGGGSLVRVETGGELTMENGVTLRDNKKTGYGGGVYFNGGSGKHFFMNGGEIRGNETTGDGYNSIGGGVYFNGATFVMQGQAQIINNKVLTGTAANVMGGGVYIQDGSFTMKGSALVANNISNEPGGGVLVRTSGTFTMEGDAKVSGNQAGTMGGGVCFTSNGTFTMNGNADISHNQASANGGGVYVGNGTFNMSEGTISGNQATNSSSHGGGVYVIGGNTFNKTGGTIYGIDESRKNTVVTTGNGHAVYAVDGPIVKDNTVWPGDNIP
jgi:hypothetical protein